MVVTINDARVQEFDLDFGNPVNIFIAWPCSVNITSKVSHYRREHE